MEAVKELQYEVKELPNDELGNKVTSVVCHGRLIFENANEFKQAVKALLPAGGRVVVDLSDLHFLDSSGLGALLALRASAIKQGYVKLEFVNLGSRIMDLIKLTSLEQFFSS